jgi:hypothetical protein
MRNIMNNKDLQRELMEQGYVIVPMLDALELGKRELALSRMTA